MIYLVVIVIYFLLMFGIGILNRKMSNTVTNFFIAGRRASTLFVFGSLVATIVGGSATIGMAGLGFSRGLTGVWWMLVGCMGLVVLGIFFAGKIRSYALFTLPQLVEKQYGTTVSVISSILIVIAWIGVIAGQIVATGQIFSAINIGNPVVWMVLFTIVFISYTLFGGQRADIITDLVQALIIFGAIFATLIILVSQMGGLEQFLLIVPSDKLSFPFSDKFNITDFISYLFIIGLVYVVGPDIYSRLFCSDSPQTARKSAILAAIILVPIAFAIVFIGIGAALLFPDIKPEQAFPMLVRNQLPAFAGALVLAGLISATMSSADSTVMSASSILTLDIIKRIWPKVTEKQILLIGKLCVVFLGTFALLLALTLKGVINALLFAYTVYTGGVIIPVIFGFFKDRLGLTWVGAIAAIIGGGITALISRILNIKYLDLCAIIISLLLLFIFSILHKVIRK